MHMKKKSAVSSEGKLQSGLQESWESKASK